MKCKENEDKYIERHISHLYGCFDFVRQMMHVYLCSTTYVGTYVCARYVPPVCDDGAAVPVPVHVQLSTVSNGPHHTDHHYECEIFATKMNHIR